MQRGTGCSAILISVGVVAGMYGCSKAPVESEAKHITAAKLVAEYSKSFSAESLAEVTDIRALPPGIRDQSPPPMPNPPFIVAGLSKTSALVAYQVGDYVPIYEAHAYVFRDNRWIKVRTWNPAIGKHATLMQLVKAIQDADNPVFAQGLQGTLSQLNLSNPVADLDRNLKDDKTYLIGLCEAPGHTPGVTPVDEALVHTPAYGLWCLPGSGDPITTQKYAYAIEQARNYSSQYNAELLRRIHHAALP